ncbi:MAG TPA: hypothetical protein VFV63_10245 [Ilumatobacteraceae bacterium]|nr:hypothetical protein [Ilumatobacteraceae bacterium]
MPTTTFNPAVHGFRFDNRFRNVIATLPGVPKLRTSGRCGGMAYASLDYFSQHRAAPTVVPVPPARVPPDGHPLADYLLRRQLESFDNDSALRFISWTLFPDEGLPFAKGVRHWTATEIPGLKSSIDKGHPVVIGLIGARSLSDVGRRNHQAVAFGYQVVAGGVDVLIYDPNTHGVTSVLQWRKSEPLIQASNRPTRPWRGLFVHDYESKVPPKRAG